MMAYGDGGRTELYILSGQSNAEGRAAVAGLSAQYQDVPDNVEFWFNGTRFTSFMTAINYGGYVFGAAPTLAHALSDARPKKRIVLVQSTLGGTTLYAAWRPPLWDAARGVTTSEASGVYQYHDLLTNTAQAIGKRHITPMAIYWWQGEQDASISATVGNDYAAGLANLMTHVAADIGAFEQLVIGRTRLAPQIADPGIVAVRAAQDAAPSVSPGGLTTQTLDFDAMTQTGDVHLDAAGYMDAGTAFAAAYPS